MALYSKTGLWRVMALTVRLNYRARPDGNGGYWAETPLGRLHFPHLANFTIFHDVCEPKTKEVVRDLEGRLFLDIGANMGYYSMLAAKNKNYVIAVEPDKKAFLALQDNIDANGLSARVEPHNVAAWSANAEVKFMPGKRHDTGSVGDQGLLIKAVSIDALLDGRVPSLVKIDAEGAEPQILRGMTETLEAHPKIVFEALTPAKFEECQKLLDGFLIEPLDRTNYLAS